MTVLMRRAIAAAAVVVGSCISIAAQAYTDADVQAAYQQGYHTAMAQAARGQANAQATAAGANAQPPSPAPQPKPAHFVDLKETYSDAGDKEDVQYIPIPNGAAQQAVPQGVGGVRAAPSSQAVVQVVPNPQSQVADEQESPQQREADIRALRHAIQQLNAWAAALPHENQPQAQAEDADDTTGAPVSMVAAPARSTQYVGVDNQAPPSPAMPPRGYTAPPPPAVSQGQPSPAGGHQLIWSHEFQRWVYLAQ
jgi:hypothetical protein